jgi:hypothetical protein
MCGLRMGLGLAGFLASFRVISLPVMFRRGPVLFCSSFVMFSGLGVRFLGHGSPPSFGFDVQKTRRREPLFHADLDKKGHTPMNRREISGRECTRAFLVDGGN